MITVNQGLPLSGVTRFLTEQAGTDCLLIYHSPACRACLLMEPTWQSQYTGYTNIKFVDGTLDPLVKLLPTYRLMLWDKSKNRHRMKTHTKIVPVDNVDRTTS